MQIKKQKNYTHIAAADINFDQFFSNFKADYPTLKSSHLIVDLSNLNKLEAFQINSLEPLIALHKANKKSFIIIANNIDIDVVLEEIPCVPTLKEAEDTLEMEEMERDLGF